MAGEDCQVSFVLISFSAATRGEREERGPHSRPHKQGYRSPGLSCGPVRDNGHTQGIPDARNASREHRLAEDEGEIPGQVHLYRTRSCWGALESRSPWSILPSSR